MKRTIALCLLLLLGCNRSLKTSKSVAIFINPANAIGVKNIHAIVYLNDKKLIDKNINNNQISKDRYIGCVEIDDQRANRLLLKVNYKQIQIPLNTKSQCINVFSYYDNLTKIQDGYRQLEVDAISKKNKVPNFKEYYQKYENTEKNGSLDSLTYIIQLNQCYCDSMKHKI